MGNEIVRTVYIDAEEVAEHCGKNADYMVGILNNLGLDIDRDHRWLRDFAAALDVKGEAALRAMVAAFEAEVR